MHKIEKKDFGYHLTLGGFVQPDEMDMWYQESLKALESAPDEFGVFADLRDLKPLPSKSQEKMELGQKEYKMKGMVRSVVILSNTIITMQFKRIGKKTGIYEWERYVDASSVANWEEVGIKWIAKGVDPDA